MIKKNVWLMEFLIMSFAIALTACSKPEEKNERKSPAKHHESADETKKAVDFEATMEEGKHISKDCPIKVELLKATEWGKGGMWTFMLNITLANTSADTRWFLVGRGFNKPLKEEVETWRVETGYFKSQNDVKFIYFYSSPGITAFLIPGSGQITLENWDMNTVYPEVETLYVWQVEKIEVNDSESTLKLWLPVDFLCPASAFVIEASDQMPTHFHKIGEGEEGKVRFVGIEKKWAIQVFDHRKDFPPPTFLKSVNEIYRF